MPEETSQLPVSEQEVQIEAPSFLEKIQAQKKKILIGLGLFLGVLAIVGAILAAYLIDQRSVYPEPVEGPTPEVATPTPDPTAGWETYINEEYGYSIKYPKDAEIDTLRRQPLDYDHIIFSINAEYDLTELPVEQQILKEGLQIRVIVMDSGGKTAKEFLSRHVDITAYENKISTLQIGGIEAYSIRFQFPDWNQCVEVVKGDRLYEFQIQAKGKNQESSLELVDLMLPTFKFLEEENKTGKITGRLCYPSSYLPKGQIVAKNIITEEVYKQDYPGSLAGGGVNYTFELITGKYILRYETHASVKDPELFSSGYYSTCPSNAGCKNTDSRSAVPVEVISDQITSEIDLCDFYYLPETEPNF